MGDATGAQVNMRQVTIVVSLGLANANSGNNDASTQITQGNVVNELQSGDFVNVIDTGDATAANQDNLVVMCQRINADDIDCLEPPTTTTTLPVDDPPPTSSATTTTTTVSSVAPNTVVTATTTTTVVAATTTCPEPPTTTAPPVVDTTPLPPGFTPGMVLPATC